MVNFTPTCPFSALNLSNCGQYTGYGGNKITAVPPAWFFWRDYRLVVGNLSIVPPLEPCCLPCCNFRFFLQCHCHYKGVKIFKKGVSEGKDDFVCWKLNSN